MQYLVHIYIPCALLKATNFTPFGLTYKEAGQESLAHKMKLSKKIEYLSDRQNLHRITSYDKYSQFKCDYVKHIYSEKILACCRGL